MTRKKQHAKKPSLAERVKALRDECDAELDRLAEELRPKGPTGLPAGPMRAMWEARGGGHVFDPYLIAVGQL